MAVTEPDCDYTHEHGWRPSKSILHKMPFGANIFYTVEINKN
jgi:hypothetical protein